jgi:hypothetical protein
MTRLTRATFYSQRLLKESRDDPYHALEWSIVFGYAIADGISYNVQRGRISPRQEKGAALS